MSTTKDRIARYQNEYGERQFGYTDLPEANQAARNVTIGNALDCMAAGEFAEADNWISLSVALGYKLRKYDR